MTAELFRVVFGCLCAGNLLCAIWQQEKGKRWTFNAENALCCLSQYLLWAGLE